MLKMLEYIQDTFDWMWCSYQLLFLLRSVRKLVVRDAEVHLLGLVWCFVMVVGGVDDAVGCHVMMYVFTC